MRKSYEQLEAELKETREALQQQQREAETLTGIVARLEADNLAFQSIFDAIADPIFLKDERHRWVLFNQAFCQFLGRTHDELLNQGDEAFFPPEQVAVFREMDEQVFRTGQGNVNEEHLTNAEGQLHTIVTKKSLLVKPDGSKRLVGIIRDVTEQKRAEDENAVHIAELKAANRKLQESERYKDEFFSVISHELRTPLNFIIGFASILEDEVSGQLNPQQRAEVHKIILGADRMLALVTDLLDMSRIQAGRLAIRPGPVRYPTLVDNVRSTLQPLATEKGLTLVTEGEADVELNADSVRIEQVLTNLIGNAIKFTPSGGRVATRSYVHGDELVFEVSDTGPGIPEGQIPTLFKRFQQLDMSATRKAGGTGLGLAISKALVEAHGGMIGARSTPGAGATFWVTLPLAPRSVSTPAAGSS